MIAPIETLYKGYRFRSRLEARWAVFFDALDIEWDYEMEGFDIDGEWYLPDFFLPISGFFVEIKGRLLNERENRLLRKLDDYPPSYAMGAVRAIGVPEAPKFHYEQSPYDPGYWHLLDWSGNSSFIVIASRATRDPGRLASAVRAARSARFEHGEKP